MKEVYYRPPLPPVTRFFLAAMAALFLLALAMHISLQRQASEEAVKLVRGLADEYQWTLEQTQLHMLRGILTLRGLHISGDQWQLDAPYLLLRGHFSRDAAEVRLSEWHMQRGQLHVPLAIAAGKDGLFSQLPDYLRTMLSDIRLIDMDEVNVTLRVTPSTPLLFERTHLRWQHDGQVFANSHGQLGFWQWRKSNGQSRLDWQGVKAAMLFPEAQQQDVLKGHMRWQSGRIRGHVRWQSGQGIQRRLAWQGKGDLWHTAQLRLHAINWPLISLPLPNVPAGCQWQQGWLNGAALLRLSHGHWSLHSRELRVEDIQSAYAGKTCTQANHLVLYDVAMQQTENSIHVGRLASEHGQWYVRHTLPAARARWSLTLEHGEFHDWELEHEDGLMIRDLYGSLSIPQPGSWQVAAYSQPDERKMGQWKINAVSHSADAASFDFSLQGNALPLSEFRNFLPPRITTDSELSGHVHLNWQGRAERIPSNAWQWHGQGEAVVDHVQWRRSGWQASTHMLTLRDMQWHDQSWHIGRVELMKWQVLAPLVPLTESALRNQTEPLLPFWLQPWEVDELRLAAGEFAVGWPDPAWVTLEPMQIQNIRQDVPLEFKLRGEVLKGALEVQVQWFPWQQPQRMHVHLKVQDALPFTLNNWLLQSDIPDFIQGRLESSLEISSESVDPYQYDGVWRITMKHGELAQGVQQSEQFHRLTGYHPRELMSLLTHQGMIRLEVPLHGQWQQQPLNWSVLASGLVKAMRQKGEAFAAVQPPVERYRRQTLAYIRLHQDDQLWPNERARVRKVIRQLKKTGGTVELVPQLGRRQLDDRTITDILYSQQLLEAYLTKHGINRSQIIPLWPQPSHHAGGEAGIRMQLAVIEQP